METAGWLDFDGLGVERREVRAAQAGLRRNVNQTLSRGEISQVFSAAWSWLHRSGDLFLLLSDENRAG